MSGTTEGTHESREHAVDRCREVLDRAFEYLDGEMADLDCDRLRAHLAECASCVQQLAEDEQLKRAIRDGCPCESAPEQLRARILVQITEVRAVIS